MLQYDANSMQDVIICS